MARHLFFLRLRFCDFLHVQLSGKTNGIVFSFQPNIELVRTCLVFATKTAKKVKFEDVVNAAWDLLPWNAVSSREVSACLGLFFFGFIRKAFCFILVKGELRH